MVISDIFEKMANNARITPQELQQLNLFARNLQVNDDFISGLKNGRSNISVGELVAKRAFVMSEQLSGVAARYYENALSVATSTYTGTATWTASYKDAAFQTVTSGGITNIVIPETGTYFIHLLAMWTNIGAAGVRDSGLSVNNVASSPANNEIATTSTDAFYTYLYAADEKILTAGDQLHITHWQTSGSTVSVRSYLTLRKIR